MTLLTMIFLHIIDDFILQVISWPISKGKQKSWWKENEPDPMYRYDYLWMLLIHSFSWTFMIMLPLAWSMNWNPSGIFFCLFTVNVVAHGVVDHVKANLRKISVIQDQLIHMVQIVVTFLILAVI